MEPRQTTLRARWGEAWRRHRWRMLVTMAPVLLLALHAAGAVRLGLIERLDHIIYDARLRATMPRTHNERIVIVDIDEPSLRAHGQWPWSRDLLKRMLDELFDRQKVTAVGFDIAFPEPDRASGSAVIDRLASEPFAADPAVRAKLQALRGTLDNDAAFAAALRGRPVVLGYYLSSDRGGFSSGELPAPIWTRDTLPGREVDALRWNGYGANLPVLAEQASSGGFFNSVVDQDGIVRSVPLIARLGDNYYESLALALFRVAAGMPAIVPRFAIEHGSTPALQAITLRQGQTEVDLPVSDLGTALVPYLGPGGPSGGSFRYVTASDIVSSRLRPGDLAGKLVLVGTTAPGLLDLRSTPVAQVYPGVEIHANLLAGWLDGRVPSVPDYAIGYELLLTALAGIALAIALPLVSAVTAVLIALALMVLLIMSNVALHWAGLALPLAGPLLMAFSGFALNMSYGYLVESRAKRGLARLFGSYVPKELVDEMVRDPEQYTMQAINREMTVMFCDMRGFTTLSEGMEPVALQALLNTLFSRLSKVILEHGGTIDKYMGDCVMAFWGAPLVQQDHARRACMAAQDMIAAVELLNVELRAGGSPAIEIGIGINTGLMCVGDMGSDLRRSYTVIGDVVNTASRIESLRNVCKTPFVARESVPSGVFVS